MLDVSATSSDTHQTRWIGADNTHPPLATTTSINRRRVMTVRDCIVFAAAFIEQHCLGLSLLSNRLKEFCTLIMRWRALQ